MRPVPRLRALLVLSTVLSLGLTALPAPAQEPDPPTLRLVAARNKLTVNRYGLRVYLDLGVWAAATGGDFRLAVSRPDYESPLGVVQTDGNGEVIQELPADLLDGWLGLRDFIGVTFRKPNGRYVAGGKFTFCPNAYERQRVDDTGPDVPTYPDSCGSSYFPFLKGTVWGIDGGWAVSALGGSEFDDYGIPSLRVAEGRYQVTVRIDRQYAELFGIAPENARVVLDVTVRDAPDRFVFSRPQKEEGESLTPTTAVPTITDPDPSTLPDLAALPLWSMSVGHRRKGDFLSFAASPWNAGPAPLVVEGFRRPGEDVMDAYQYFYDEDENVVGRAPVGTLEFHSGGGHNHWHFLQLVEFSLLDSSLTEVVLSKKQSFCIAPTDAVDLSVEGADYVPWSLRLSSRCGSPGSIWVREALAAGWADTYFQYVSGQAFNITKVPNGWYYVRLEMNPHGNLYDSSLGNEVADRLIRLGGKRGSRTLRVMPWFGIED
ncbi:MAG: lysyl oxidase family protein [Actinomycetota bacterium]